MRKKVKEMFFVEMFAYYQEVGLAVGRAVYVGLLLKIRATVWVSGSSL
jgi:hypothetical protein